MDSSCVISLLFFCYFNGFSILWLCFMVSRARFTNKKIRQILISVVFSTIPHSTCVIINENIWKCKGKKNFLLQSNCSLLLCFCRYSSSFSRIQLMKTLFYYKIFLIFNGFYNFFFLYFTEN